MKVIISARNYELSDSLKKHTEERMNRLGEEYKKLNKVHVVMDVEHGQRLVEIHILGKNLELEAKAEADNMMYAVDSAFEKIEKQLRRHLDKMRDHSPEQKYVEEMKNQGAVFAETGSEMLEDYE
jgi:putative sigma-54 modulation protein